MASVHADCWNCHADALRETTDPHAAGTPQGWKYYRCHLCGRKYSLAPDTRELFYITPIYGALYFTIFSRHPLEAVERAAGYYRQLARSEERRILCEDIRDQLAKPALKLEPQFEMVYDRPAEQYREFLSRLLSELGG